MDRASFRFNGHTHDQGATRPTEDGQPRRQLYVNLPMGRQLRYHLTLKKALLEKPELVQEYAELKRELAKREHEHIGAYGMAKSEIIEKMMDSTTLTQEELMKMLSAES